MEKNLKKNIYLYLYIDICTLNHFAVHLKHCK